MRWIVGFAISLGFGYLATQIFLVVLRRLIGLGPKPSPSGSEKGVPGWFLGLVERSFFTTLVGLQVAGAPAAMMGWLALKLAANWNHPDWKDQPDIRTFALSALLAGLVSMLFALLGGMVCSGGLSLGV
jgi:hypothetical protein